MPDTGWTLEVVDVYNNSTVWDDVFATDTEALRVALEELEADGIEAYIGPVPGGAQLSDNSLAVAITVISSNGIGALVEGIGYRPRHQSSIR